MDDDFKVIEFFRRQSKECDKITMSDNYLNVTYSLPNQPHIATLFVDMVNNEFILFVCDGFQKNLSIYSEKLTIPPSILKSAADRLNKQTVSEYEYEVFENSIAIKSTKN